MKENITNLEHMNMQADGDRGIAVISEGIIKKKEKNAALHWG